MNKSELFTTAWSLFKNGIYTTFGEALKASWAEMKLRKLMANGKVLIEFVKGCGEITERLADVKTEKFKNEKPNLVCFYSLTDDGFRSCKMDRVLSFKAA